MDPSAALARPLEQPVENRVMREIQQAADALPPHPAKWKAGDVERWWHRTAPEVAARARLSETPSMGPSVDGKALVRFSKQRFAARASGGTPEHRDAFGAGMLEVGAWRERQSGSLGSFGSACTREPQESLHSLS